MANSTSRLEARLPDHIHAAIKRAAEMEGRSVTDFVVSAAYDAARQRIEASEFVRLSVADQQRFAEALIEPPALTPAMERALDRHRRLIGK